jgi:hypothetical protein
VPGAFDDARDQVFVGTHTLGGLARSATVVAELSLKLIPLGRFTVGTAGGLRSRYAVRLGAARLGR